MFATKLSPEIIRQARDKADEIGREFFDKKYQVEWSRVPSDKRKGTVFAWNKHGYFLGCFHDHAKALKAEAILTRINGIWFLWESDDPEL